MTQRIGPIQGLKISDFNRLLTFGYRRPRPLEGSESSFMVSCGATLPATNDNSVAGALGASAVVVASIIVDEMAAHVAIQLELHSDRRLGI